MANKKTSGKNKEQPQSQPSTPQMENEQPIVNEQEQGYPVNPQDTYKQDSSEDFTSEKEMNTRSQQEEASAQQQMSEHDKEDIEADSEDVDNGLNKVPKMNP